MANSQIEPWNNLWADLSQGMTNSQMEPWNNLWADLSQGMANSDGTLKQPLGWSNMILIHSHVFGCHANFNRNLDNITNAKLLLQAWFPNYLSRWFSEQAAANSMEDGLSINEWCVRKMTICYLYKLQTVHMYMALDTETLFYIRYL